MSRKPDTQALDTLREHIKAGDTIYTSVVQVARSGMSRHIKLYFIRDNAPWEITWLVGRALGWRVSEKTGGLVVSGCGMDMCFHTVYSLSSAMYPHGHPCSKDGDRRCFSNDHVNSGPQRNVYGPGVTHRDGGYALNQRHL